jgi:hypothetical protein
LGALVTTAFFAKMQTVPIVAAAGVVALACVYVTGSARRVSRPVLLLSAGAALLPALIVASCAATGSLPEFWVTYISGNWSYAQSAGSFFAQLPNLAPLIFLTREFQFLMLIFLTILAVSAYRAIRCKQRNEAALFLEIATVATVLIAAATYVDSTGGPGQYPFACSVALVAAAVSVAFLLATGLFGSRRLGWFGVLSGALLAAGLLSVYAPRRGFPHYLLLLVIPLCTAMGWLLVRWARPEARSGESRPRVGFSFVMLFLALIAGWGHYLVPSMGYNFNGAHPMATPEGGLIQSLTRPGSGIVVWGWHSETYLSAGRVPATRDTVLGGFVNQGNPAHDFYRDRFLRDLRRSPADLIVDALDVSCCYFNNRKTNGFEAEPLVRSYIYSHYIPVADAFDQYFYLRRDLAGAEKPGACAADAIRCYESSRSRDRTLAALRLPEHALLQLDFAPLPGHMPWQTVLAAEPASGDAPGFRLVSVGANGYRLLVGAGDQWIAMKDLELADGKRVSLTIELNGAKAAVFCDGKKHDELALPGRMSGAPVKIMLAPLKDGRSYVGAIDSFQIRDLGATNRGEA